MIAPTMPSEGPVPEASITSACTGSPPEISDGVQTRETHTVVEWCKSLVRRAVERGCTLILNVDGDYRDSRFLSFGNLWSDLFGQRSIQAKWHLLRS